MKYVTFHGGFHRVGPIRLRVTEEQYNEIKDDWPLGLILSEHQLKRLDKHFCGVWGCLCGGWRRGFEVEL